jgi:transglutaminase-like putative cysteine protease
MNAYLKSCIYINWQHPKILAKARELSAGFTSDEHIAKNCFHFVRDEIKHSWDYLLNPVTSKASDVLELGTGYCYAKSHLLAALLRANEIPTGLCYQRLTVTDSPPYCLHGLNAIHLKEHGWYKVDARGNKLGINAEFTPPVEQLAFSINTAGEQEFPHIFSEPHPLVIATLNKYSTIEQVYANLPDLEFLD